MDAPKGVRFATSEGGDERTTNGERKYARPSWGEEPDASAPFSFEVVKNGVTLGKLDISRQDHYLIGRQRGVVDLLMEHPSLSRQHAVIQYSKEGLLLGDLGSTHGTYVNHERLKPTIFRPLHVGDVLKFGESSRIYVVQGPEDLRPPEYESASLKRKREQAEARAKPEKEERDEGATWGFDDEAVNDDDDDNEEEEEDGDKLPDYLKGGMRAEKLRDTKLNVSSEEVSEKDLKQMEKLRAKVQKIENLYTEMERIQAKDNSQGGLTDGQKAQISRNEARVVELRSQIADIENSLKGKKRQRDEAGKGKEKAPEVDDGHEESDFDFYDRTATAKTASRETKITVKQTKEASIARRFGVMKKQTKLMSSLYAGLEEENAANTHKSLLEKKESVLLMLTNTRKAIEDVDSEIANLDNAEPTDDALEAFMRKNKCEHFTLTKKALMEKEKELLGEAVLLDKRIATTRSALPELHAAEAPDVADVAGATVTPTTPPLPVYIISPVAGIKEANAVPALTTSASLRAEGEERKVTSSERKRARPATTSSISAALSKLRNVTTEGQVAPVKPMSAAGAAERTAQVAPMNTTSVFNEGKEEVLVLLEDGSKDWVPPPNQTGDGRTSLNQKLGY